MRRRACVGLLGTLLIGNAVSAASAASYAFTAIDIPGPAGSAGGALGINGAGQMVGGLIDATSYSHGFLLSGGSLTLLDVPGSDNTSAHGINDAGDIVGFYSLPLVYRKHTGFLYSGGNFTTIDPPGAIDSVAEDINNSGQIAGWFNDGRTSHGFLFSQGGFVTIDPPNSTYTLVNGINDAGQMVGTFSIEPNSSGHQSFLLSGGAFTILDAPGAEFTRALGINNAGEIVGTFTDVNHANHAFVFSAGAFTTIDFAGSVLAVASGINNNGQIVGGWGASEGGGGSFLASPAALVNDLLTLDAVETRFFRPSDNPFGQDPAGAFEIVGRLRNGSARDICSPFIDVVELSGGNRLIGAFALTGDGEAIQVQNLPSRPPLVFANGATIPFQFIIGLQTPQPFNFLVNISGASPAAGGSCQ